MIIRLKSALLIAGLSLLALTGCAATDTVQQGTDTTSNGVESAEKTVTETTADATKAVEEGVDMAKDAATETATDATKAVEGGVDAAKDAAVQGGETLNKALEKGKDAVADVMAVKDGVTGMKDGLSQTMTAVRAGDFTKANEEFGKVKTAWTSVEETVKTKSAEKYTQIETAVKNVDSLLKAENPDKTQVTSALETLSKDLAGVSL